MNNNIILFFATFLAATVLSAQTFTFTCADSVAYGVPGSGLYSNGIIHNTTPVGYYVDVIRVVNDTAPKWQTAFCLDGCYPPTVDSARFYLLPDTIQYFVIDFFTDTLPDTSTVLMKFKNVSVPSNVVYQKYTGIADPFAGLNELAEKNISVHVFPSPVLKGEQLCVRIADKSARSNNYSLFVYDLCGRGVSRLDGLSNGSNYFSLNLPQGLYVYSLSGNNARIHSGRITVLR